jgi:UPF0716 family protein affecting phage T7 exclusion
MGFWFLVFFLTPILEMYLLIEVGGYIGTLPTIALVMLTAVVGVVCLAGGLVGFLLAPARLWERCLLVAAALVLIKPGVTTDLLGALFIAAVLATQISTLRREAAAPALAAKGGDESP